MVDNFLIRPRLTRSQFSDIRPYTTGLVAVIRCAAVRLAGLVLEVDASQRLPVGVADEKCCPRTEPQAPDAFWCGLLFGSKESVKDAHVKAGRNAPLFPVFM